MNKTPFFRLLADSEKEEVLRQKIASLRKGNDEDQNICEVDIQSFRQVPGSPFGYWVSDTVLKLFVELPPFQRGDRCVKVGLGTADDFRFLRHWIEVPASGILNVFDESSWQDNLPMFQGICSAATHRGARWVPFAKGGTYSPFYNDIHLVLNWEKDGQELKDWVVNNPADPTTRH